jgi:hypothetical protein
VSGLRRVAPTPSTLVLDSLHELGKLGELLVAGMLTQAEFDEQKSLILARRNQA